MPWPWTWPLPWQCRAQHNESFFNMLMQPPAQIVCVTDEAVSSQDAAPPSPLPWIIIPGIMRRRSRKLVRAFTSRQYLPLLAVSSQDAAPPSPLPWIIIPGIMRRRSRKLVRSFTTRQYLPLFVPPVIFELFPGYLQPLIALFLAGQRLRLSDGTPRPRAIARTPVFFLNAFEHGHEHAWRDL